MGIALSPRPGLPLRHGPQGSPRRHPEQSDAVEAQLRARLARLYGAGTVPNNLYEVGATLPRPGLSWRAGENTLFLHANRKHVEPAGIRLGVQLIAVRREVLERRELELRYTKALAPHMPHPGRLTAAQAREALLQALRESRQGEPEHRAQRLLVTARGEEIGESPAVRRRLVSYRVRYTGIGHYSGALEYDRSLLFRAWREFPETPSGQRAFARIQDLTCGLAGVFGCRSPNCFRPVIRETEKFLRDFPDSPLRLQQLYRLAVAHDTWWSLSQAAPGDPTAEGARVTPASAESARKRAIDLYEEVRRLAPQSPEAGMAALRLPRLKLGLDTGERRFFCFSC